MGTGGSAEALTLRASSARGLSALSPRYLRSFQTALLQLRAAQPLGVKRSIASAKNVPRALQALKALEVSTLPAPVAAPPLSVE